MLDHRPQADRLRVAELFGESRHRAKWRPLTGEEQAAAVAELKALAGGRTDLLAEVAGVLLGAHADEMDAPLTRRAARLCLLAGADPAQVPAWVQEGRRRRAAAGQPPFSGGSR